MERSWPSRPLRKGQPCRLQAGINERCEALLLDRARLARRAGVAPSRRWEPPYNSPTYCAPVYRTRTLSNRAMPRRNVLIAVVAVVAVLAIGLTQLGGTSGSGGGGKAPTASEAAKQLAGSPPKLDALHRDADKLLPGKDLQARIAALKGYPIVLNVWGSWCVPCRQEFPVFQRVSVKVGKRVAFVGLVTQDPTDESKKFLKSH